MHHDEAVSVFHRITEVVGNHNGRNLLFLHDLVGKLHNKVCGLRIKCCRMLIQNQELNRRHRRHE